MNLRSFKKALPYVLTALTCIGVGATAFLNAKAGAKSTIDIQKAEEALGKELDLKEKTQLCWRNYILSGVVTAATIGTCIAGRAYDNKRVAKALAACVGLEQTFKRYREEMRKEFGDDADLRIMGRIPQEAKRVTSYVDEDFFGDTGFDGPLGGEEIPQLFYDSWSDTYFEAPPEQVYRAMLHLNNTFVRHCGAQAEDWYRFLGVTPKRDPKGYVWINEDDFWWIPIRATPTLIDDGGEKPIECCILDFGVEPWVDEL